MFLLKNSVGVQRTVFSTVHRRYTSWRRTGGENMIDAILHSVEQAEKEADEILQKARKQAKERKQQADVQAEELRRTEQERLLGEAQAQKSLCLQEEEKKMEAEKETIRLDIRFLKAGAEKREDEIVSSLLSQIF